MKILLVDDEYGKAQSISEVLTREGISSLEITHETTAHAARQRLRSTSFDMLIIDMHLPDAVGSQPTGEGGIAFFDLIGLDDLARLPADVLFITGREELYQEAEGKVLQRGAVLCQWRADSDKWKAILLGRTQYASRRLSRKRSERQQVDVAIVTALRTPELEAVLQLPYGWSSKRFSGDPTTFHFGNLQRSDSTKTVVAACAQRKGMPSAAALSAKLAFCFRPKYLVMLGICAGVPGKTNFGDVVVADPTWDWGSGKRGEDPNGSAVFLAAPHQMALNSGVSQLAIDLSNDDGVMRSIRAGWSGEVPQGTLKALVGPMASGGSVIADDWSAQSIAAQHRELLAIEMEAYAVMSAAEYSADPKPCALVIKSVCDHANTKKNDDWQKYASYTSAAFADRLLRDPSLSFDR